MTIILIIKNYDPRNIMFLKIYKGKDCKGKSQVKI